MRPVRGCVYVFSVVYRGAGPGQNTQESTVLRRKRKHIRPVRHARVQHNEGAAPAPLPEVPRWARVLRYRVPAAALLAAALVAVLPGEMTLASRLAIGWLVYIGAQIAIVFRTVAQRKPAELRAWASQVDLHAPTFALFLVTSAAMAVISSLFVLAAAEGQAEPWRLLHLALGAGTVLLTWFGVQVAFAARYASLYYGNERSPGEAGLDFPEEPNPDFLDFLYFSTCAGMTFEASDVRVRSRRFRHWLTFHAVFSFVFASINLALLVDIAASVI